MSIKRSFQNFVDCGVYKRVVFETAYTKIQREFLYKKCITILDCSFKILFIRAFCKSIIVWVLSARGLIFPGFPEDALSLTRLLHCGDWSASVGISGDRGVNAVWAASTFLAWLVSRLRRFPFGASKSIIVAFCVIPSSIPRLIPGIVRCSGPRSDV